MKFHTAITSLLISSASINDVDAQITTYPCPSELSSPTILPLSSPIDTTPTTIRIPIISASNGLCILTRRNISTQTQRAPLARSYAGHMWENSPGLFAKTGSGVNVDCSTPSGPECDVTVPPLLEGFEYILESYMYDTSAEAEAARFLEQATFGPTREDIDALTSSSNDFSSWVEDQLSMPVSSHRAFFREHVNPKYEFPFRVGAVGPRPCELHSRWRRYAITSRDQLSNRKTDWFKHLTVELIGGKYIWKVDGYFRTATTSPPLDTAGNSLELNKRYRILHTNGVTWKRDCIGCTVNLQCPTCSSTGKRYIENPIVSVEGVDSSILNYNVVSLPNFKSNDFPTIENTDEYPLFDNWIHPYEHGLLNTTSLEESGQCDGFPSFRQPFPLTDADSADGTFPAVFGKALDAISGEEVTFVYDPHLKMYENTIENPLMDGGGQLVIDTDSLVAGTQVKCQNAKRTFLNDGRCKLSYQSNVCSPGQNPKNVIIIDEETLAGINSMMNKKLYVVKGLAVTDYDCAPCTCSTSRWMKDENDVSCANTANIGSESLRTFADLISGSTVKEEDYNPSVVQVKRSIRKCDSADNSKLDLGAVQTGDGTCWKHVHRYQLDVIDFTAVDSSKYTMAGTASVTINDMTWFNNQVSEKTFEVIGKLGDHIDLSSGAPAPLNDVVQDTYGITELNPSEGPVLVCGSPQESSSDPFHGEHGFDVTIPEITGYRSMSIWELSAQRHTTWEHLAMHAQDQLRQRTAWALSQIVAVGLPGSGMVFNEETEHYIAFYDMFINNSFGNYLKLMKEFSFNNIMGGWLSFKSNKSLQYNIDELQKKNYPDENFAREIMQLFSIGLYSMNMDGSLIIDDQTGFPVESYTIDDIVSYARSWTGFVSPSERGGVSVSERQSNDKYIDPMKLDQATRDKFPKTNLVGGYIGDHVPLCEDLPSKHHLRKGATYRALGLVPKPEWQDDMDDWVTNPDFKRLQISPSSPLYAKLCAPDVNGDCTTPTKVVLDENLIYDAAAQAGHEYNVDTIRTVAIFVGVSKPIYYEYIRQPCVELAFFNDAKKVMKDQVWQSDKIIAPSLCGNPKLVIAKPLCMSSNGGTGKVECSYQGERVSYATAEAVCAQNGQVLGQPGNLKEPRAGDCAIGMKAAKYKMWTSAWCKVQVKIDYSNGQIAIVNEVEPDLSVNQTASVETLADPDTLNFFKSTWTNGLYPSSLNDCLLVSSCYVHDGHCICDTDTSEAQVFGSASEVSSTDQLLSSLSVGAVDPATYDAGTYNNLGDCGILGGVEVHSTGGDCSSLSSDTIFAFEIKNKQYFLMNKESTVHIVNSDYSFRNPVSFTNLVDPEVRDMHYEVDEVLESLFYHPSHPPFMASRMIQRFGVSNPSPRFIESVATAYSTGTYDNGRYGSGSYGDLGALVAAILLDHETREVVVDADPSTGHIREPLIKVLSFFRAQGVSFKSPLHVPTLLSTESKIGQGSYESPSVFSFFLPEYVPFVPSVQSAGLVAPESMVLNGDNVLDLLDSMFSVVKFGVTNCYNPSLEGLRGANPFSCANTEGDTSLSMAAPQYEPPSTTSVDDILDDLAILLTAGRLTDKNRAIIKPYVQQFFDEGDVAKATRVAQQLIFASPEYHATGVTRNLSDKREVSGYDEDPVGSYKAVVVLMTLGGADSFNLLVPVSGCATSDQYQEYRDARGDSHSLPLANLTTFDASSSNQDCNTFGVNNEFDYLAQMYNEGDALFLANTGILSQPTTKYDEWNGNQNVQLFAHNTMVHEFYRGDPFDVNANTGVLGRMLDKLKLQGYQTSANARGAGGGILVGDQQYQNPVYGVSTSAPQPMNQNPALVDIYEVVKELNSVGDVDNSVMTETWSKSVASALFEQEQMQLIAAMPEFDIESYGEGDNADGGGSLGSSFKAIVEYMKSRHFRKVNREAYVLKQTGYDHHGTNAVSDLFSKANNAIKNFVAELKEQGLWDNTVLIMSSGKSALVLFWHAILYFGRSLNPNSNGGTDHAWAGNYFMAGGQVKGGQVLGRYPQPMSEANDHWIGRGRFIPTTPWDAVWTAVSEWMGVQDEQDLDWILPNRYRFDTCTDLYHDTDMFKTGGCTCTECTPVTDSPTVSPPPPTPSPTRLAGDFYEAEDATLSGSNVRAGNTGFYGTGYADMGGSGSYVEFTNVDAGDGGACTLTFRYANGGTADRPCEVKVNGTPVGTLSIAPTNNSWESWAYESIQTQCPAGMLTVRFSAATSEGGPNLDSLNYASNGGPPAPPPSPEVVYQTEDAQVTSSIAYKNSKLGYTGTGYLDMGGSGSYFEFTDSIDGGIGGTCTLSFRYANGDTSDRPCEVKLNGVAVGSISFSPTNDWEDWQMTDIFEAPCEAGMNTLRITASTGAGGSNIDSLTVVTQSVQGTPEPTSSPITSAPVTSASPSMHPTMKPQTDSPSMNPTVKPTPNPTVLGPSPTPSSASPTTNMPTVLTPGPSVSPTKSPETPNPTFSSASGEYVKSIFEAGSIVEEVGCQNSNANVNKRIFDESTEKWYCGGRKGTETPGLIVSPLHGKMSIAKKLRIYTHNNCPNCDAVEFILSGRVDSSSVWVEIDSGDLPWRYESAYSRNSRGLPIDASTYESGDTRRTFTEVDMTSNNVAYLEYKVQFPKIRSGDAGNVQTSEIELPGYKILSEGPVTPQPQTPSPTSASPTSAEPTTAKPSLSPSDKPVTAPPTSSDPSVQPTMKPVTDSPSMNPTMKPTPNPTISPSKVPSVSPSKGPSSSPVTSSPTTEEPSSASPSKSPTAAPQTDEPTPNPTVSPSHGPTKAPLPSPSDSPSLSPITPAPITPEPTNNPTTASPTSAQSAGEFVNTIFDKESSVESACSSNRLFDQSTEKWGCDVGESIIITPSHGMMSIAKKLRVYSANNCPSCDPISYVVSGRVDTTSPWVEISAGGLPDFASRNQRGYPIVSTYENGDPARYSVDIDMSSNTQSFFDYKIRFPANKGGSIVQASEVELPGWVIWHSPTLSPTESPIAAPPQGGVEINNILEVGSTFSDAFGGCSTSANKAIDKKTEKYACSRPDGPGSASGFTVSPASGKMSVVKQFRLYAHNNCGNCDVVSYILEGRVSSSSSWVEIGSGDLPWKETGAGRNSRGLPIVSTFESGDPNRVFTHVSYPSNTAQYLQYRVSFTETRNPTSSQLQFSELELAGYILD